MILIAKNETGLQVSVFFKHDTVFASLLNDSARRIRTIIQSAEDFDTLKMSSSDKEWYDDNIQVVTDELYKIVSAYIKGNELGYNPNVNITENEIDIGKHVTYLLDIPDFDYNSKNELENQMYKFIKTGIMSLWFNELNNPVLFQIMETENMKHAENIHSILLRRVNPIRRMMNHFP